jgi:AraC-like DNA-binding protein
MEKVLNTYIIRDDFRLTCWKALHSTTENTPTLHSHRDFYELLIVYGGEGVHRMDGRSQRLVPGIVLLVKPGHPHEFVEYHNLCLYNLLFSEDYLPLFLSDLTGLVGGQLIFNFTPKPTAEGQVSEEGIRIPEDHYQEIMEVLESMSRKHASSKPGDRALQVSEFVTACYLLASHCRWTGPSPLALHLEQITLVQQQLRERMAESWSLAKMAALAKMSVSAFRQGFRAVTGRPPLVYLLRMRIAKGERLLLCRQPLSMADIAYQCGFADANYFSRQFKRVYGVSPFKFRRRMLEGRMRSE